MIQSEICQTAWLFAARKHKAQLYPGSEHLPYLTHIGAVLLELLPALQENPKFDADTAICCALLHDTVEDTETTIEEIAVEFGEKIAAGVSALTKLKSLKGEAATRDSLERIKRQPHEIWAVKLSDRAANMLTFPDHWGKEKQRSYAREARIILESLGETCCSLSLILARRIKAWEKKNNIAVLSTCSQTSKNNHI
jgi:(p)ppGpp synthase/HD superfamily hydrolase